jgi:nicotinamide-nucleotide amidase
VASRNSGLSLNLSIKPYLEAKSESVIYYKMLRTFGIGESMLETELQQWIDGQTDPTLATYAKEGEACLRITSKRRTLSEAKTVVEDMIKKVNSKIGKYVYSYDDEEYFQVVGKKLIAQNISFSGAESCTGGLFAMTMAEVPGISAVFDRGFVTYSNKAKMDELGVNSDTLEKYGAVSEETAIEMAEGVKKVTGSRLCISVTGIAGPDGGTEEKPVGLVYVGLYIKGKVIVKKFNIPRDRQYVRRRTVMTTLDWLRRELIKL